MWRWMPPGGLFLRKHWVHSQLLSVPYALVADKVVKSMSLSDLSDVSDVVPQLGQTLQWNGVRWVPAAGFGRWGNPCRVYGCDAFGRRIRRRPADDRAAKCRHRADLEMERFHMVAGQRWPHVTIQRVSEQRGRWH